MGRKNNILLFLFCCGFSLALAQTVILDGNIIAEDDVEGIHILNLSNKQNTVTNQRGAFEIAANLNDTLLISAIMYEPMKIVINQKHINQTYVAVRLDKKINFLDEVLVGKILTGSLDSDMNNTATSTVDLQKLGVPGFYGKPLSQTERRLADADKGKYISSANGSPFGLGLGVNVHKILNKVSGRTKTLKYHVALDREKNYIDKLKAQFKDQLFENHNLTEGQKNEFFYFCADDEEFKDLMKQQNDALVLNFLLNKLDTYNNIINNKE